MNKNGLSNSDSRTIRRAGEALDLLMTGAISKLETDFGPSDSPDRSLAIDSLILHLREQMEDWMTSAENERSNNEIALTEGEV